MSEVGGEISVERAPPVERIYIGGLNPPRLSARDVAPRIRSLEGVEILSVPLEKYADKSFFHFTARVVTPTNLDDTKASAFGIIAKQYHNVKWKGCRMQVESAKPHFLERLEMERQEKAARNSRTNLQNSQNDSSEDTLGIDSEQIGAVERKSTATSNFECRIPRNLRIRRRFGEEAFHVDTKPRRVGDWSSLHRILEKTRRKRNVDSSRQQGNQTRSQGNSRDAHQRKSPQTNTFLNRATHVTFVVQDGTNINNDLLENESSFLQAGEKHDYLGPSSVYPENDGSETDDDDFEDSAGTQTSDDEIDVSVNKTSENNARQQSAYQWSDEDSSLDSKNKFSDVELNRQETAQSYEWLDSESDEPQEATDVASLQRTTKFEEFDDDIDFLKEVPTGENGHLESKSEIQSEKSTLDIARDVQSNLVVLSQLFPEMSHLAARKEESKQETGKAQRKTTLPTMQRYDPTQVSSKQFEVGSQTQPSLSIEKSSAQEDQDDRDEASDESELSRPKDRGIATEEGATASATARSSNKGAASLNHRADVMGGGENQVIYEQKKLERIFQEARQSGGGFGFQFNPSDQSVDINPKNETHLELSGTKEAPSTKSASGGSFSFGFSLGEDIEVENPPLQNKQDTPSHTGVAKNMQTDSQIKGATKKIEERFEERFEIRRGFIPSMSSVEQHVKNFFELNEGNKLTACVLENRKDDRDEHEAWMQKRKALTLDWKRKRKMAVSRIQKKTKFL